MSVDICILEVSTLTFLLDAEIDESRTVLSSPPAFLLSQGHCLHHVTELVLALCRLLDLLLFRLAIFDLDRIVLFRPSALAPLPLPLPLVHSAISPFPALPSCPSTTSVRSPLPPNRPCTLADPVCSLPHFPPATLPLLSSSLYRFFDPSQFSSSSSRSSRRSSETRSSPSARRVLRKFLTALPTFVPFLPLSRSC